MNRPEYMRVSGPFSVRKGGSHGALNLLFFIWWSHAVANFSDWTYVDMVSW